MKWEEIKENLLSELEVWAENYPNERIEGQVSGKLYTPTEWVQEIKTDTEDGKAFVKDIWEDTIKEYKEKTNQNV